MSDNSLGLYLNDATTMTWLLEYGRSSDLNLDLTQYTMANGDDPQFSFTLFVDQPGVTFNIALNTTGGGVSSKQVVLTPNTTKEYLVSIYDFVGTADLANIDKMTFTFNTTVQSTDIIFSGNLMLGSVPEPHTAVMLLIAGGIFRVARRKKLIAQGA